MSAFSHGPRQPPHEQHANDDTSRGDIDELRNDEEPGFAKHARDFRREEAVLAAEKQSKISIFYDVTAGIQGNDEQQ